MHSWVYLDLSKVESLKNVIRPITIKKQKECYIDISYEELKDIKEKYVRRLRFLRTKKIIWAKRAFFDEDIIKSVNHLKQLNNSNFALSILDKSYKYNKIKISSLINKWKNELNEIYDEFDLDYNTGYKYLGDEP